MKKVVIIHGGHSFDNNDEYLGWLANTDLKLVSDGDWKSWLRHTLNPTEFEVLQIRMPNSNNAQYAEWKTMFEKALPLITENDILIGHSLGGIFLAKYLSENNLKIHDLHLVATPSTKCGSFELKKDISSISRNVQNIFLWHSTDDFVVPFAETEFYTNNLPKLELNTFDDRGHFNDSEFVELFDFIINSK